MRYSFLRDKKGIEDRRYLAMYKIIMERKSVAQKYI